MPSMNRRTFLKLGMATAAITATGVPILAKARDLPYSGGDFSPTTGKPREPVPTACWQCVTRCAIIGYKEDDRLVKLEGNPDSIRVRGRMCSKGQAGVNQVYDPDRILFPLMRTGKRGEGKWKRISWEDASAEVLTRLKEFRDAGTPEKFMFHYGRMKGSSSKLIKSVFLATYGTKTIGNHTSICEGGKWTAQELTWGKHYDNWDVDHTRYILNFGSNVFAAHTNHIPLSQRFVDAVAGRGVKMVTFDVRLSNTAAQSSEWVPIIPGTDSAVVLAMCNVIMQEGLYKGQGEDFLQYCRVTPDYNATTVQKVDALKQHLAKYTPEWAGRISGVDPEKIKTIAREFATIQPACLISYRGAVAHYNGCETERTIQMLAAITGNIDNPGGRCRGIGAKWSYPKGPKNKPKGKGLKILDGFPGEVALPTHHVNHQVLKMIKDGRAGRPELYMWYCYTPVYANGNVQENIDILKDEKLMPFTVCVSPFYDESAALADLILPDATYLERWDWEDMVSPTQVPEYYIRQPVVPPMGETRDFGDVCCDWAEQLGFPLGFKSKEEFVNLSCQKTAAIDRIGGLEFMKKQGVWHDPKAKPKFYGYKKPLDDSAIKADGVILDPATGVYWNWKTAHAKSEEAALATGYTKTKNAYKGYVGQQMGDQVFAGFKPDKLNKSGYFEFYSDFVKKANIQPLPSYIPIPEHEKMGAGELHLTTYKAPTQIHSRSANCKWLTELYHDNPAWLNPATADRLGLKEGDLAMVKSPIGSVQIRVKVTPQIVPGTIGISHHCGHWEYGRYASGNPAPFGREDPAFKLKWWEGDGVHPNWIIPNAPDPVSGQMRFMDTVVTVRKVT